MSLRAIIESGEFWRITDHEAVEHFGREFAWELDHLRKATPTIEAAPVPAKGFLCGKDITPSRHLYGEDFPEVNRTMVSMLAIRWIVNDEYDAFAGLQSDHSRLSRRSWDDLRKSFKELLVAPQDTEALLVATVVSDIGKDAKLGDDPKLVHDHPASSDEKINHDEIAFFAAESDFVPSVNSLHESDQHDVMLGLQLATKLNVAQLAQGENVPGSLTPLFAVRGHWRAFKLKMAEIILDVAGAGGHRETRCAQQMNEPTFRTYHITIQALSDLLDGKLETETDCYNQVLRGRAEMLVPLGFRALPPEMPKDRVLLRLLSIGRVSELSLAHAFSDAFESVLKGGHENIITRLNASGLSQTDQAVLPYYAPALCSNVISSTKDDPQRLRTALAAFMRFLCRSCDTARFSMYTLSYVHEADLSFAVNVVRSVEFKADPRVLDDVDIPVTKMVSQ